MNKAEACELQIQPRISGNHEINECFEQFESMDLNKNELISCQEITVEILIGEYLKNQVDQLGSQIKMLYAKKPENCKKVFPKEIKPVLESFESSETITDEEVQEFITNADYNSDGRMSCEGKSEHFLIVSLNNKISLRISDCPGYKTT